MVFDTKSMVLNRRHDYTWGNYQFKQDANVVGAIVEGIEDEYGEVTSEALLDVARDEKCPIHDMIEWNDAVAAEKQRLSTCSHIINALRVVVKAPSGKEKKVSAFLSVKVVSKQERTSYKNVIDAMSNEKTREIILKRMRGDMESFIERYSTYEEADGIIKAMNEVLEEG